ncbi:MAG TPA: O-antigen ligase family protein [Alphaproteobacteria bacterium]|nr:O-antigen ligase family protein [Alphaproteobacteria bacterium]
MAILTDRFPSTSVFFASLAALVATVMALQAVGPAPVLALYIVPWIVVFFYHRFTWLLMLWPGFLPLLGIFPELTFRAGPITFLPLDPVYFLSLACFAFAILSQPTKLVRSLKVNPYLSFFLLMLIAYIILFTPIHGKSAIGEARKFYFYFLLPLLTVFFMKTIHDLHRILLAFLFAGICLLIIAYLRLGIGTPLRDLAHSGASLILLFMVLTILVFHLNQEVLLNRNLDLMTVGLAVPIILMTQHRTVFLASAFALSLVLWLYRHRTVILAKAATAVLVVVTALGVVMVNAPSFERYTVQKISGLINPAADRTGSWRIEGWQQQLGSLSGPSLFFGEGLGSYYSWMAGRYEVKTAPHNAFVQLVLKFGLVGLMIYVVLALRFFRTTLSARRSLPPGRMRAYVEVGLVNYGAAHAYMMGYGFELSMLIFFALAMGAATLLRSRRNITQPI